VSSLNDVRGQAGAEGCANSEVVPSPRRAELSTVGLQFFQG